MRWAAIKHTQKQLNRLYSADSVGAVNWIRRKYSIVLVIIVAMFAVPICADLSLSERDREFDYVAADSFYYLTVSRNIVEHGQISFDQEYPTNGFHPLWQASTTAMYGVLYAVGLEGHTVVFTVLFSAALLMFALVLFARLFREDRSVPVLYALLPVGVYSLLFSIVYFYLGAEGLAKNSGAEGSAPLFGTLWSFTNGMESAVTILFFALVARAFVRSGQLESNKAAVSFGLLCAGLTLSRLDHGVFVLAYIAALAVPAWQTGQPDLRKRAWLIVAGFIVPLVIYLLINKLYAGSSVPTSGSLKTDFPRFTNANIDLYRTMKQAIAKEGRWFSYAYRLAQMVVPPIAALIYMLLTLRIRVGGGQVTLNVRSATQFRTFLVLSCFGVWGLGSYNFFFVHFGQQGHWYFPLSILFVSLAAIDLLERLSVSKVLEKTPRRQYACLGVLAAINLFYFAHLHRSPDFHKKYEEFYRTTAPKVRQQLAGTGARLFSMDDGIVAFSTGLPTMSGTGLGGDLKAIAHVKKRTIGDLAIQRGYTFFTSLVYYNLGGYGKNSDQIGKQMKAAYRISKPEEYTFKHAVEIVDPRFGVIEITPKSDN